MPCIWRFSVSLQWIWFLGWLFVLHCVNGIFAKFFQLFPFRLSDNRVIIGSVLWKRNTNAERRKKLD